MNVTDPYRPLYHFTPPSGWMNDPNGLVYYAGEYHLFYQYLWPRHWGHAVSHNLVHWESLPIALAPDEHGDIWSGSVVVDEQDTSGFFGGQGGLVAIFTHQQKGTQKQSLAYSRDKGRTWEKYEGNPVLTSDNPDFRDPKVQWHEATRQWSMVLSAGDRVHFYTSSDLKTWTYRSDFGAEIGAQGLVWECPDMFPLVVNGTNETKWVLNASFLLKNNSGGRFGKCAMRHFIGDFDGIAFVPDAEYAAGQPTDFGPDDYAGITWTNGPDAPCILIGWMNDWSYADKTPTSDWKGAMTLPRQLTLVREEGRLRLAQTPIRNLPTLRAEPQRWEQITLDGKGQTLLERTGEAFEIVAEFDIQEAQEAGLRLRKGGNAQTVVGYEAARERLFVDRTHSGASDFSLHFAAKFEAPLQISDRKLALRIFVDRCSVEVFDAGGNVVLSALIFPDASNQELEVYAGGGAALLNLEFRVLKTLAVK